MHEAAKKGLVDFNAIEEILGTSQMETPTRQESITSADANKSHWTSLSWTISDEMVARIAIEISSYDMKTLALVYFGLSESKLKNIEAESLENAIAFNQKILHQWRNRHWGEHQRQVKIVKLCRPPFYTWTIKYSIAN